MSVRKFRVTVNGKTFDVEVEEVAGVPGGTASRVDTGQVTSVNTPVVSTDGNITAPIPGKVLAVDVKQGAEVHKGDRLLLLESMKIENPILAPCDGRIKEVLVLVGTQVRTGALLLMIDQVN